MVSDMFVALLCMFASVSDVLALACCACRLPLLRVFAMLSGVYYLVSYSVFSVESLTDQVTLDG